MHQSPLRFNEWWGEVGEQCSEVTDIEPTNLGGLYCEPCVTSRRGFLEADWTVYLAILGWKFDSWSLRHYYHHFDWYMEQHKGSTQHRFQYHSECLDFELQNSLDDTHWNFSINSDCASDSSATVGGRVASITSIIKRKFL